MIDIVINIKERPAPEDKVAGRVEAKVFSKKPTKEEISIAAEIMEALRAIANRISLKDGAEVTMLEIDRTQKDVRHHKQEGDRRSDGDSGNGPAKDSPEGESGGSSPSKD